MLVHLSNTSPYVCDLNRGPIEESNRMASAPTKKATAILEHKESFPKATRTPLKLLAPDEVPMDTTTTATDINASLQPIWYSEQTIVDDHSVQQEDIASIIREQQGKSLLPRTTLPPIPSESPSILDEEQLPNQPSLMHKSSTFTIESSTIVDSPLNDSEKENTANEIIPSTDDSFRALEQLLGLGSTTTIRDSPKTNHDTLSLTVVTPTDIINATTTSLRMSYAPKSSSDSLPSSQDIPTMPTIESINSTNPPSFLMDNTAMEEEQTSTTLNQQNSFENDTMKDDTNTDDDTNFSFELNDFQNNSKNESTVNVPLPPPPMIIRAPTCADVAYRALIKTRTGGRVSQPVKADSPLAKPNKLRSSAPTSRMLRSSCRRISTESSSQDNHLSEQPIPTTECFVNETNTNTDSPTELVEMVTLPEEDENEREKTTSVTLNLSSPKVTEEYSTPTKPMMPILSREYTYNTPSSRVSERHRSKLNSSRATTNQEEPNSSMLEILLTKPTEAEPNVRKSTRKSSSIASKSMLGVLLTQPTETEPSIAPSPVRTSTRNSPSIASKSMLEVLLTQPTEAEPSVRTSTRNSPSIASKSMLGVLLTQPTEAEPSVRTPTRKSPSVVSKSMLGVLLTQPTELTVAPSPVRTSTPDSPSIASKSMLGVLLTNPTEGEPSVSSSPIQNSIRKSARSSSHPIPKVSINPLHSSTPSASRHKSLQIVSIGEQEQVSTIVPQSINNEQQEIEIAQLNDTEESIEQSPIFRTMEMGVQTTPSLDISSRRRWKTLEQQVTPIVQMNTSSSLVIINEQKQMTPLQTKAIMNLQRNVRFQLTPSTNARLVEKEKFEENLRGLKPDIVIEAIPIIPEPKQETIKPAPIKKATKPKKKVVASKKKKAQPKQKQPVEEKSRQVQKEKPVKQQKPNPSMKESKKKPEPTKRAPRKQPTPKVTVPTKRVQRKQPTVEVAAPTKRTGRKQPAPEVALPIKRASRKRAIPEAATEPAVKRVKTSKSVEVPPKTQNNSNNNQKIIPEPIERKTGTRSRSTNNKKVVVEPKDITPVTKTSKRRLESVDKNEGIKKKAEEEKVQSIPPVQNLELSQEERQKIEALTVAGLKSRLNTHKADIPKGAKKADLIALLIQIETNLIQERKHTETTPVITTTTMTTRRRKK